MTTQEHKILNSETYILYQVEVCFCREKSPDLISKSIMAGERSEFSHVLCKFEDHDGSIQIFHSIGSGAQIGPEDYLDTREVVKSYKVPLIIGKDAFIRLIKARSSKVIEYSESQYFNQIFRIIFNFFGFKVPKWFPKVRNGDMATICSEEMVISVIRYSIVWDDVMLEIDPDQISPKMLETILSESAEVLKIT